MEPINIEEQLSETLKDHEDLVSDSESVSPNSSNNPFEIFTRSGMIRVEEGENEHKSLKKGFLEGIGRFGDDTEVVAIHKCSNASLTGQARLESFQIFKDAVAKKRGGNANVKCAWYSSSKEEIIAIVCHGFSRCEAGLYGHGVYLSPTQFAVDRALTTVPDENGLRHLLLCNVILGNMEAISPGSKQFRPTSMEFDSGVDNVFLPRKYIIWSPYMNSHIFPVSVISFKAASIDSFNSQTPKPNSPYMMFPRLVSILARHLHPSQMALITRYYNDHRENKLTRSELIQILRQIAGDELLTAVILANNR